MLKSLLETILTLLAVAPRLPPPPLFTSLALSSVTLFTFHFYTRRSFILS